MINFLEATDWYLNMMTWPSWLRKLFVLTCPISFPIWILGVVPLIMLMLLCAVLLYLALILAGIWTGKDRLNG